MGFIRQSLRAVSLFLCVLLGACVSQKPAASLPVVRQAPEPSVSAAELEAQRVEAERQTRVRLLLRAAQGAFAENRLMTPAGDNAFEYYRQVLRMDSENAKAHSGMHRINSRYLDWAEQRFAAGDYSSAEQYLQQAQLIATSPVQARALRVKYPRPKPAAPKANEFILAQEDLAARNSVIVNELTELAHKAQSVESRLVIVARNDDEGRWIYQKMRDATSDGRLRGNIEIGGRPRVVLIDWAGDPAGEQ